MVSKVSTRKVISKDAPSTNADRSSPSDEPVAVSHRYCIATAAYYKAEARGFEPGHELNDWLQAEAECNYETY